MRRFEISAGSDSRSGDTLLRFAEPDRRRAPAGTQTPADHSTRHRLMRRQVTATRRGSPVDTPSERAPALLRDAAQSSRQIGHPSGSTPAPRRAAPPPSVAAAVRWSHGSGMPSHLDIERAKHTHRSQPRQRRTTASSPPCENLTAATTKLLCGVAAANISSGRQRRAGALRGAASTARRCAPRPLRPSAPTIPIPPPQPEVAASRRERMRRTTGRGADVHAGAGEHQPRRRRRSRRTRRQRHRRDRMPASICGPGSGGHRRFSKSRNPTSAAANGPDQKSHSDGRPVVLRSTP